MGLLAALPVLVALVPAAVVAGAALLMFHGDLRLVGMVPAVALTTVASLRSVLALDRAPAMPGARVPVTPAQQPWLWALAREAAAEAGTFAPGRVLLVSEPVAGVVDHTRWFGLRSTGRSLVVGAPVFLGFSRGELRAALVRSFAVHAHVGLDAIVQRGAGSMLRVPEALEHPGLHWFTAPLLRALANAYLALVTSSYGPPEPTTLEALATVREAWQFYMDNFVTMAWHHGYLPARLAAGFRRFLGEVPTVDSRAELLLLDHETTVDTVLFAGLPPDAPTKLADWDTVADAAARGVSRERAAQIREFRSLPRILDGLDAHGLAEIADPGLTSPQPGDPPAVAEAWRRSARHRLSVAVTAELAAAGRARWRMSWTGPPELVVEEQAAVASALDAACAEIPDTTALRELLAASETSSPPGTISGTMSATRGRRPGEVLPE
ncbi:hypothetical protein ACWEOE_32665 [Amycolatopsis sp. NPDC004368]